MSKIVKLIMAQQSHPIDVKRLSNKLNFSKVTEHYSNEFNTLGYDSIKYEIGVRFGAAVYVPNTPTNATEHALDFAIRKVKRAVIEEVFGEFRVLITQMHVALIERDFDKVSNLLEELDHLMFIEGLK